MSDASPTTAQSAARDNVADKNSSVSVSSSSGNVRLSRSQQTWTGAGSAAGFVLRYLAPMRRLMIDVTGDESRADQSLAILIQHLVKTGYGGHDKGRLRDFLIRGMRSAGRAQLAQAEAAMKNAEDKSRVEAEKKGQPYIPKPPLTLKLDLDIASLDSPKWLDHWREGLLQRAWRALERHQHAMRHRPEIAASDSNLDQLAGDANQDESVKEDLIYDVLHTLTHHAGESAQVISGRIATTAGRTVDESEVRRQLDLARVRFAQFLADEVAQTLDESNPKRISAEIKTLGLQKAFAGVTVKA